jgi:predicted Zn-dependent peptidase
MYHKTTLSNGLRVVTNQVKDRNSLGLGFWVGVGGRYEEDRVKGAAHFLEHIVFKGSHAYSCEEIKEKIEGVGGALNAFTSEEQTCFYAKIPSVHLEQTFDILADMVFFPNITQKDVAKECTVIVEEIKMYRDLPQYFVIELLDQLMFPDHPLGKSLAGTPESVSGMKSSDLRRFHAHYYAPKNIVISACGKLTHKRIVDLAKKKLGSIKKEDDWSYAKVGKHQTKPRVKFFKKDIEQMHLALGMPGYDENHKDRYVLSMLNVILGGNMSSRLFVEVREKRGLAYSIGSSAKQLHDTGVFMVRAGVDNQKVVGAMDLILKELKKVKENGVSQGEFIRARDYLLGQLMLGLEDTLDHMLWMGESVMAKDKIRSLKSVIAEFEKIKRSDIQRIAKDILKDNRYSLAIVGPVTNEQEKELSKLMQV